jgi:CMP/dCMP kinase
MVVRPRQIAVDGPAGSGKSTVSFALANELGYLYIDTGAFYRAVTLAALDAGLINAEESAIVDLANRVVITVTDDRDTDNRQYTVLLDQQDVTWKLRTQQVDVAVSRISAMSAIRQFVTDQQRAAAQRGEVILVGRDIGTVVLPDADLKLYLDASIRTRAERRYRQIVENGGRANLTEIENELIARDAYDSGRAISPLRQADDAIYVSTDTLSIEQVVERVKQIILDWQTAKSSA